MLLRTIGLLRMSHFKLNATHEMDIIKNSIDAANCKDKCSTYTVAESHGYNEKLHQFCNRRRDMKVRDACHYPLTDIIVTLCCYVVFLDVPDKLYICFT